MIFICALLFTTFCFLSAIICLELQRKRLNKEFAHIPGPKQYPVIGNLYGMHTKNVKDFNCYVEELSKAPLVKLVVPGYLILGVSDPDVLQQVLMSSAFLSRVKYFLKFTPWDEAMLTAPCPNKWRYLRKMIQPAFAHKHLLAMIPIFNKHLHKFNERLKRHADSGESVNLYHLTNQIGMEEALETILNCTDTNTNLISNMFKQIVDNTCERVVKLPYHSDHIYKFTENYKECNEICVALENLFKEAVKKSNAEVTGHTLLHRLLKQEEETGQLTLKQVKDNALIMFGAGYETTAITISHAILLLAMYPEIDQKLFDELSEHYKEGDPIDYSLLKQLNYLDMVLKEVLRLFPTVPVVLRQAAEEKYIDGVGLIPKGTIVIPILYKLHRWTEFWGPDANKFNPDNFLPENICKRHPSCYLPFSMGPRNCIGLEYAQINLKMALVHLISRFRFETSLKLEELPINFSVFLRLECDYVVKVYNR